MNGNNKGLLRGILAGVYVLLIALLLLSNCHGFDRQSATVVDPVDDNTTAE